MNPVKKALTDIRYRIPREILERVFIDGSRLGRQNWRADIEEQILSLVVRPRVLVDCNMIGGTQHLISLEGLPVVVPTEYQWATVVHIPKERTFGKSINSVLNVTFFNSNAVAGSLGSAAYGGIMAGSTFNPTSSDNSAMMSAATSVLAAQDKIPMTGTSRVQLIAENTVLIRDGMIINNQGYLRCILADDEDLSSLQLRSYRYFVNLVEYAVKSFIYNELKIQIDVGELRYGQNVGAFKEVVDSYADAEANYQTYLRDVWEKVAFMNDEVSMSRFISMLVGAQR